MKGRGELFVRLYTTVVYAILILVLTISMVSSIKELEGEYHLYYLSSENSLFFYTGLFLIWLSICCWIARTVGPLGVSITEIFWRFSNLTYSMRNPFMSREMKIVALLWVVGALLIQLVFLRVSIILHTLHLGFSIILGIIIAFGLAGEQTSGRYRLIAAWSQVILVIGLCIILSGSFQDPINYLRQGIVTLFYLSVMVGVLLSIYEHYKNRNKYMPVENLTVASLRRTYLNNSLLNMDLTGSAHYSGVQSRNFITAKPHQASLISLISSLNSIYIFILLVVVSIPTGILCGISLGENGIAALIIFVSWIIAIVYRLLPQEWVSQYATRLWLGGSYLKQLFGYSMGPTIMSVFYTFVMAQIFSIPSFIIILSFFLAVTVSFGDPTPPLQINYDLLVVLHEGIVIPLEQIRIFIFNLSIIGTHIIAFTLGATTGTIIAILPFLWTFYRHSKTKF